MEREENLRRPLPEHRPDLPEIFGNGSGRRVRLLVEVVHALDEPDRRLPERSERPVDLALRRSVALVSLGD